MTKRKKTSEVKTQQGQSLWEIIVALAVAGLITLGLVTVITNAIKGVRYSSSENQATTLAQKKLADYIDIKNRSFTDFQASYLGSRSDDVIDSGHCVRTEVFDASSELPPGTPDPNAAMLRISVDVFWDEKGLGSDCDNTDYLHKSHFETYVTN